MWNSQRSRRAAHAQREQTREVAALKRATAEIEERENARTASLTVYFGDDGDVPMDKQHAYDEALCRVEADSRDDLHELLAILSRLTVRP